mmetsp:Transcript_3700/g.10489  ORF Transcript_3700/g.10489 Transcript_3700/m.10489 type:complete len:190 (-) Transcript_3700:891-1460(-)
MVWGGSRTECAENPAWSLGSYRHVTSRHVTSRRTNPHLAGETGHERGTPCRPLHGEGDRRNATHHNSSELIRIYFNSTHQNTCQRKATKEPLLVVCGLRCAACSRSLSDERGRILTLRILTSLAVVPFQQVGNLRHLLLDRVFFCHELRDLILERFSLLPPLILVLFERSDEPGLHGLVVRLQLVHECL